VSPSLSTMALTFGVGIMLQLQDWW
jgi:hypothetical protein